MDCTHADLPYQATGYFTALVHSYVTNDERLKPFVEFPVSFEGVTAAIAQRQRFPVDRATLVTELQKQYAVLPSNEKVLQNIELLALDSTFTVCTAHQPAIFTGNLFFIYKILHAIRLAETLQHQFPQQRFVPVYYMGSEDADLEELGHVFMNGRKINWDTDQRGAIGRMHTKGLDGLIQQFEGELLVMPHGPELIALLRACYVQSADVQTATLRLVHELFARYGLVVLIPDNAAFKKKVTDIFLDDLRNHTPEKIVSATAGEIARHFKPQAHPRAINLFYLKDDIRERIERRGDTWRVLNTDLVFDEAKLIRELENHPERFSPNVILRGILQETILPNVAFVGGGGELAYWMELKALFHHYHVPYPLLVLRNSFLLVDRRSAILMQKFKLTVDRIFKPEIELQNELVRATSDHQLSLANEIDELSVYYGKLANLAAPVDITLAAHVDALRAKAEGRLKELEKKLLRAEKRRHADQMRQLATLKRALFPIGGLQERVDNFMPFFARWGKDFIGMIYRESLSLEQRFRVLQVAD